jgi:protein TonB
MSRLGWPMRVMLLLSVGVHLAAVAMILLLPQVLPHDKPAPELGTVEFVMREQKGAKPIAPQTPADNKEHPPAKAEKPSQPRPDPPAKAEQSPQSRPVPPPPVSSPDAEPVPSPVARPPTETAKTAPPPTPKAAEAQAQPPSERKAPVMNLNDATGEYDAIFSGDRIVPAALDSRFRNRPPDYPNAAAIKGEHGTVQVLIHVGVNGLVTDIDVLKSSGFAVLDEAALAAARKWRFHPAMKEGQAAPFDLPFNFVFQDR